MKLITLRVLIVLVLVTFSEAVITLPAAAQIGGEGAISGTVTDNTGAAIPGASVTATNVSTNVSIARKASSAGYYLLSPLVPGEYRVTTTAAGFGTLTQQHVIVDALQTVGYNPRLSPGAVSEVVNVTTQPPALETENATLGTTMEQKEYTNLPLNMNGAPRNPTSFVGLMPGVNGGVGRSGEFNGSSSAGYLDEVYVDGVPLTAPVQQGDNRAVAYALVPEAVDQFQVQTSGSPVEFDGAGVQNYVIKSGSNDFHGSAFAYVRNTIFDTWGFSGKLSNINSVTKQPVKPVEHNLEVGGTLGGHIIKNKLFFFASYDNFKYTTTPNPSQYTIPTMLMRNGDFTEATYPIFDPATTAACTAAKGYACRYQFMGMKNGVLTPNVIDPSRISPIAKKLAAALPVPTNNQLVNNYFASPKTGTTYWKSAERIDYDMTSRQRFSGIVMLGRYATVGPDYTSKLPIPYGTTEYVSQNTITLDAEHTYTLTPHLVNQFKYAFNRLAAPDVNATLNTPYTAEAAGLTGLPAGEAASTFPAIAFSGGVNNPTSWHAITGSVSNNEVVNTFILIDNMQYLHGKHSMTFGGQIQWLQDNYKYPANSPSFPMSYTFNSAETANYYDPVTSPKLAGTINSASTGVAYASFLVGAVGSASQQVTSLPETGARFKTYAPYFQDDYKILHNLTVNLGVRWDIWTPFKEVRNRSAYLDPTQTNPLTGSPGALRYYGYGANSCHCESPIAVWWKNFAPRFGVAYSITPRAVIRAAYGINYARDAAEGGHNSGSRTGPSQQGFAGSASLSDTALGVPAFSWDANTSNVGTTVYGAGSFPGSVGTLPNTDPTQLAGNSSNFTNSSGVVVQGSSIGYADPYLSRRVPYFQNINVGVEYALTNKTTLSSNYVGNLGHFVPGATRGDWSNKLDPKYLSLGAKLNLAATPANVAAVQALDPGFKLPYASFAGSQATIAQALVKFPQYSGVSDIWADVANTNYHSLQLTLNQRTWQGVTFTLNYTYAISNGDADGSRSYFPIPAGVVSGLTSTAPYNALDNTWQSNASKQLLTMYGVWELPFGKGRRFSGGPAFLHPFVNDWQFSSTYQYTSGTPVSVTSSKCVLVGQGTCFPDLDSAFTGDVRQNGSVGSNYLAGGTSPVYLKKAAFQDPAPYMIGNAPARASNNLWNPGSYSLNASLRKSFLIWEGLKFTFQADCFNVPNKVTFGYASTNIDAANFGQTNNGSGNRDWQFAGRLDF